MDLSTTYLGMKLKHPLMPGASPMVDDLDLVKKLEDAGAAAIVMYSLFEEQIKADQNVAQKLDTQVDSFAEALSYLPNLSAFRLGPDKYLEQIRKIKKTVSVPIVASLNGTSKGGWTRYAKLIEEAGADALELNAYLVATDFTRRNEQVESDVLDLVKSVKSTVKIPIAVKLSPFYSSLPNFATKLDQLGVDGIVLFNRFYQPDIDIQELKIIRTLQFSTSAELLLRIHALGILSGHIKATLVVSGGVHSGVDAIKALMSGANAVQVVSALLLYGPNRLRIIREEIVNWMEENEYESIQQMIGSMSLQKCPDPRAFERLNYMEILKTWR